MIDWLDALLTQVRKNAPCVLITVADCRGSVPRERGAKMLVSATSTIGSIGGGQLEYRAIELAREFLQTPHMRTPNLRSFALGPKFQQCCGGHVDLLFEPTGEPWPLWIEQLSTIVNRGESAQLITHLSQSNPTPEKILLPLFPGPDTDQADLPPVTIDLDRGQFCEVIGPMPFAITLFGAGHVGKALVNVLAALPCRIHWVDSRVDLFPARTPNNITCQVCSEPELALEKTPPSSFVLIMTHSHPLDFRICAAALRREDLAYCGLIGSATKRQRFIRQLREQGFNDQALGRLTCPIGIDGIDGKHPVEIAIAVSAELLRTQYALATKTAVVQS